LLPQDISNYLGAQEMTPAFQTFPSHLELLPTTLHHLEFIPVVSSDVNILQALKINFTLIHKPSHCFHDLTQSIQCPSTSITYRYGPDKPRKSYRHPGTTKSMPMNDGNDLKVLLNSPNFCALCEQS
jgi:hypothetical protein